MPFTVAVACDVCPTVMLVALIATETEVTCGAGSPWVLVPPQPTASSAHTAAPHTPNVQRIARIQAFYPCSCKIREHSTRAPPACAVISQPGSLTTVTAGPKSAAAPQTGMDAFRSSLVLSREIHASGKRRPARCAPGYSIR